MVAKQPFIYLFFVLICWRKSRIYNGTLIESTVVEGVAQLLQPHKMWNISLFDLIAQKLRLITVFLVQPRKRVSGCARLLHCLLLKWFHFLQSKNIWQTYITCKWELKYPKKYWIKISSINLLGPGIFDLIILNTNIENVQARVVYKLSTGELYWAYQNIKGEGSLSFYSILCVD